MRMKLNGMNKKNNVARQIEEIVEKYNIIKNNETNINSDMVLEIKIKCRKILNDLKIVEKSGWVVDESKKTVSDILSQIGHIKTSCSKEELSRIVEQINVINNSASHHVDMFINNEKSICIAKAHTLYKLLVEFNEEKSKLRLKQDSALKEEGNKGVTNGMSYALKTYHMNDFIKKLNKEHGLDIDRKRMHNALLNKYKSHDSSRFYYTDLLHLLYIIKNPNMKIAYIIVKEIIKARKMQLESYASGKLEKKLFNK